MVAPGSKFGGEGSSPLPAPHSWAAASLRAHRGMAWEWCILQSACNCCHSAPLFSSSSGFFLILNIFTLTFSPAATTPCAPQGMAWEGHLLQRPFTLPTHVTAFAQAAAKPTPPHPHPSPTFNCHQMVGYPGTCSCVSCLLTMPSRLYRHGTGCSQKLASLLAHGPTPLHACNGVLGQS